MTAQSRQPTPNRNSEYTQKNSEHTQKNGELNWNFYHSLNCKKVHNENGTSKLDWISIIDSGRNGARFAWLEQMQTLFCDMGCLIIAVVIIDLNFTEVLFIWYSGSDAVSEFTLSDSIKSTFLHFCNNCIQANFFSIGLGLYEALMVLMTNVAQTSCTIASRNYGWKPKSVWKQARSFIRLKLAVNGEAKVN